MTVYCAVDNDKYERIRFVADSIKELSGMLGVKPATLRGYLSRGNARNGLKFERVCIEDESAN
jgi:hypothetical protein